jgi:hypothetical protein
MDGDDDEGTRLTLLDSASAGSLNVPIPIVAARIITIVVMSASIATLILFDASSTIYNKV